MRTVGWNVERPCVFHEQSLRVDGDLDWNDHFCCPCCGNGIGWDEECNYDLEVHGAYYPGAPAYTPPGEYAPIDPPEPPEFHIGRVCFAGTDVEFPWSLTEDEQRDLEAYVCEME